MLASATLKPKWPSRRILNGRSSNTPPTSYFVCTVVVIVCLPLLCAVCEAAAGPFRSIILRDAADCLGLQDARPASTHNGHAPPPACSGGTGFRTAEPAHDLLGDLLAPVFLQEVA